METVNGNKNGHHANGHGLTFQNFEVDPVNRILLRDGQIMPLTGKVFDVLLAFTKNPGRLLSKDELIEQVWPGEFVEEGNLARNVSTLRKALHDDTKPHKYIATIPGRGYRFIAEIVKTNGSGPADPVELKTVNSSGAIDPKPISRKWLWAIPLAILLISAFLIGKDRMFSSTKRIGSLAVLPLRSVDSSQKFLGVGIADAVIRKISQTGELTVRPLSAVIGYANEETDALTAARQLQADAVLRGMCSGRMIAYVSVSIYCGRATEHRSGPTVLTCDRQISFRSRTSLPNRS